MRPADSICASLPSPSVCPVRLAINHVRAHMAHFMGENFCQGLQRATTLLAYKNLVRSVRPRTMFAQIVHMPHEVERYIIGRRQLPALEGLGQAQQVICKLDHRDREV